jgi:hypothetical protein
MDLSTGAMQERAAAPYYIYIVVLGLPFPTWRMASCHCSVCGSGEVHSSSSARVEKG